MMPSPFPCIKDRERKCYIHFTKGSQKQAPYKAVTASYRADFDGVIQWACISLQKTYTEVFLRIHST